MKKKRKRYKIWIILGQCLLMLVLSGCRISAKEEIKKDAGLPITPEKTEFTFLISAGQDTLQACDGDMNHSYFYKELEKRTNIHINWVTSYNQLQLQYQFGQMGSQTPDMMDMVYVNSSQDELIREGIVLDLTELVPKYAPNYYRIIQDQELKKLVYTREGRIASIYSIKQTVQKPWAGLQIREDWLEDVGLSMPETYEELEQVLTAFRDEKGATAPLFLDSQGYTMDNSLNAGYEVSSSFFHIGDQILYGPAEEGWKEYLTMMHDWYEKGLISKNFITGSSGYTDAKSIDGGMSGVWFGLYTLPSDCTFAERDARVAALSAPVKEKGQVIHIRTADSYTDNGLSISASCEHPELLLRWVDYLFSEEGALLANYGVEGETYTLDEEGNPVYTDLITENPDGLSFSQALRRYTFSPGMASGYINWERESSLFPKEDAAMCDVWSSGDTDYVLPQGMGFTKEESARISELTADLSACMQDYTIRFIMGVIPLEHWDVYVRELKEKGLEEALQIYQTAYDRLKNG